MRQQKKNDTEHIMNAKSRIIQLLHALVLAVFAIAAGAGGAVAHHIAQCAEQAHETHLDAHDHGELASMYSNVSVQDAAALATDLVSAECSQHSCVAYTVYMVQHAGEQLAVPVTSRPADTSISCLSRPESLYRPPNT